LPADLPRSIAVSSPGVGPSAYGLGMSVLRWLATVLTVPAAVTVAAPACADGDSYIRYLNDHGTFVPGINDAVRISRGSQVCTSLHNGMTPQQIIDSNPIVYFDLRGVIDAAQHELCPDTLGKG
jgi:hypothetical protein